MSSYEDDSGAQTPEWLADLVDQVFTSDFVHEAMRRAVLQAVMDDAPLTSSGDADEHHVAADVTLTVRALPETPSPTDELHYHDVCREVTLAILGVVLGTYTVCHTVAVETDEPEIKWVRLKVTSPTGSTSDVPTWVSALRERIVTADFIQSAMVGALADTVVGAAPSQPTDDAAVSTAIAGISLTKQPFQRPGSATDTVTHDCHEYFLTVAGHQLYHWTVCTTTTDLGPAHPPAPVHLEARHPTH